MAPLTLYRFGAMSLFSLNGVLKVPARVRALGLLPAVPVGGGAPVEKMPPAIASPRAAA
jgi:hypothetical protein